MIHEGLLQRVELSILYEPFHGGDGMPVHPYRQLAARVHGLAINVYGASAAFAAIAAELGAGEPQVIAQHFRERPAIVHFDSAQRAIDGQVNSGAIGRTRSCSSGGTLRMKSGYGSCRD